MVDISHAGTISKSVTAAFLSPSWPPDTAANGIVTYVESMVRASRQVGLMPCILAAHSANDFTEPRFTRKPKLNWIPRKAQIHKAKIRSVKIRAIVPASIT